MKRRVFSALLALVMVLALVGPVGLVIPAQAAVSASEAQYYLLVIAQTNPTDSFLIDFDGDGRDELLTVTSYQGSLNYSIYQREQSLTTGSFSSPELGSVCTKNGKTYLSIVGFGASYSTVENGRWVEMEILTEGGDPYSDEVYYFVNDREVNLEEFLAAQEQYQHLFYLGSTHGDAQPELEAIVQAAQAEMGPAEILAEIPYYGDRSKCRLTDEQATAFAQMLEEFVRNPDMPWGYIDDSVIYNYGAALCDMGNDGIPVLIYTIGTNIAMTGATSSIYRWKNNQAVAVFNAGWAGEGHYNAAFGKNIYGGYSIENYFWDQAGAVYYTSISSIQNGQEVEKNYMKSAFVDYPSNWDELVFHTDGKYTLYESGQKLGSYTEEEINAIYQQNGGIIVEESSLDDMPPSTVALALRAYADAKKLPTYTYTQAETGDSHYDDVTAAVAGQGTIQTVYKLLEDMYYVLLENGGAYTGAVVRGVRENGRPIWKVTRTDEEPVEEDALTQLVNQFASAANLNLDYSKLQGSPTLDNLTAYLRQLLDNIDGLAPNDPAKSNLAAFLDGAVSSLASGTVSGKDNRLNITGETVSPLAAGAREASSALNAMLRDNGVELNKILDPVVRVLWSGLDDSAACQITLDSSAAQALGGYALQILLGDGRTYVRVPADDLSALTRSLGSLSVQLFEEEPGVYAVSFLNGDGEVVDQLSRAVTISLPASGALSTVMASYAGGSSNWGGQYDAAAGTLSFETSFSGKYEVLENNVNIDDIGGLSEESRAAISFMVSKGYLRVEDGMFRPADPLTRYEFTEALVSMFFALDPSLTATFPDVPADSPYYAYVASAQTRDIVRGLDDGTFAGESNITREQVFALAARTLIDQKGYAQPADLDSYLGGFSDRADISAWAEAQVALAVREGIAKRGSALWPQANINREQAAVVLYRLFQRLYEVSPVALDVPGAEAEAGSAGFPVLAVVIPAVGVAAAAAAAAVLVMKKKKSASEPALVAAPAAGAPTAPATQAPAAQPEAAPDAPSADPKFCPECGTPLNPGVSFCPECGKAVK